MADVAYAKTPQGQEAFRNRDASLSARQRKAFLLFDGHRSLAQVLADTSGLGVTIDDVQDLVDKGFLEPPAAGMAKAPASAAVASGPADAATPAAEPATGDDGAGPTERYRAAYPIATKITSSLGLRGFRLNLQVEAAAGYDGLLALVPAIAKAAGEDAVRPLRKALGVAR